MNESESVMEFTVTEIVNGEGEGGQPALFSFPSKFFFPIFERLCLYSGPNGNRPRLRESD